MANEPVVDSDSEPTKKPSRAWYLVPIFFGIIGGLVMYLVLKDENKKMAKKGLILGIMISAAGTTIITTYYAVIFAVILNPDLIHKPEPIPHPMSLPVSQPQYHTHPCDQPQLDSNFSLTGHRDTNIPVMGLVAEWSFENNTLDTSGHGNNAGICNYTVFVDGKIGKGAGFGGVNSVIQVPNNPILNFGTTGSFTISLWMKSTQSGGGESGYGMLVEHRRNNDGQYIGYSVEYSSGMIIGKVRDRIHEAHVYSTTKVNDGKFHHIVLVFDRNAPITKLYIDGKMESSDISGVDNIDSDFDILLGGQAYPNTLVDYYNGTLDEIRIYDRALSDTEIQSLLHES